MSVTVIFDTSALAAYATLGAGALTIGEILAEMADDASATVGLPVLAVAQAWSLYRKHDAEAARLKHLLDPMRSPVAHVPVGIDDGRSLGVLYGVLGDLPRAQAALVYRAHMAAPILTAEGDRYRAVTAGLDILDL